MGLTVGKQATQLSVEKKSNVDATVLVWSHKVDFG